MWAGSGPRDGMRPGVNFTPGLEAWGEFTPGLEAWGEFTPGLIGPRP